MNYPQLYLQAIKNGEEIAPETIRAVYEREVELMGRKDGDYVFDEAKGLRPIAFMERFCKLSKGQIGKPLRLELFQKAKIQLAFGWLEKDTGLRRFREVGDVRGRKCGKSTETAGVAQYMLMADGEGGAEIYCTANKLDQAKIIFDECVRMRAQSPSIRALTTKRQNDIYYPATYSTIKAISSDTKTMDGLNAHFFCLDEWHAARDRAVYDLMLQSQSTRDQPLAWLISTLGFYREGFCDSQVAYYKDVALGTVKNDRLLPLLYWLDKKDEWTDPRMWPKANPGLGKIKKLKTLQDYVEQARNDPAFLPTVLVKDFNVPEISGTAMLPYEAIVNERVAGMEYLRKSYAIGGCDLSATTDLTCATLLIQKPYDHSVYVLQQYFLPRSKIDTLARTKSKEAPYTLWADQGWLTICDGAQVDYHQVTAWFVRMVREYNIRPLWVCYDRALSGYWVPEMEEYGFEMVKIAQGPFTWSQPLKEMMAAFMDHRVVYENNPILRWCLTNTAVKAKNSEGIQTIQPVKMAANRRIDGTVSLLNAWVGFVKYADEYTRYVR